MEIIPYRPGQLIAPRNDFVQAVAPIVGEYVRNQAVRLGKRAFEAGTEYVSNAISEWWNTPKRPKLNNTRPNTMRFTRRSYRRPVRRRRKVIKRNYRKRATRYRRRRQPSDIVHARFVLSEYDVTNNDKVSLDFVLNANPKVIASDATTKDTFSSYANLYDQIRFNMVKLELVHEDNTALVTAKPFCRVYTCYDPDNQNRVSKYYQIAKVSPRWRVFRPGRTMKFILRPKWGSKEGTFTTTHGQEWFDINFDTTKDNFSYNGVMVSITNADVVNDPKSKPQFNGRVTYYCSFKGRRTGQTYTTGERKKRDAKILDNFIPNLPASGQE